MMRISFLRLAGHAIVRPREALSFGSCSSSRVLHFSTSRTTLSTSGSSSPIRSSAGRAAEVYPGA